MTAGRAPWLLVAGDFSPFGGMDAANRALARHLAGLNGAEVHLVAHHVAEDLAQAPAVRTHLVPRPLGSHLLGAPLLARAGRAWAARLGRAGARVLVNGGNCSVGDVNWVHYVHAAYDGEDRGWGPRSLARRAYDLKAARDERAAIPRARLVVCNSRRTARDVVERLGVGAARVRVVYYGVDPARFAPVDEARRREARRRLGRPADRPLAIFVGALGDRRKGFDLVLAAWRALAADPAWDCDLVVAGEGADRWRREVTALGLDRRVALLGFRRDVADVLAACDVMVHPARYEAYGLGVHEALCLGLPAIVTAEAGVAERYSPGLRALLLDAPPSAGALVERLRAWRAADAAFAREARALSADLRRQTWDDMARAIVGAEEAS
jgi:glycosyltransferase involved in cell wall biosynthesis